MKKIEEINTLVFLVDLKVHGTRSPASLQTQLPERQPNVSRWSFPAAVCRMCFVCRRARMKTTRLSSCVVKRSPPCTLRRSLIYCCPGEAAHFGSRFPIVELAS